MSFRPRRLWSRHWRGITSSFCCIAVCMHACMHACKHARHGMRAASGARAPRRKAAGGQLETGSRQGTRWSGIKRGSIPRRDLSRVKFYFPVENLPSALSGSKERKKIGEFSTVLIYRWQNLSATRVDPASPITCASFSRGQEMEKEAELGLEKEGEGVVKRNSLTDWRTRGGRRGEWRA